MRESLRSQLQTTLNLEAAMLETWFNVQESNAESLANNVDIRQSVYPLLEPPRTTAKRRGRRTTALQLKLDKSLGPGADGARLRRLPRRRQEEADRRRRPAAS